MRWIKEHKTLVAVLICLLITVCLFLGSLLSNNVGNSATDMANSGSATISSALMKVYKGVKSNVTGIFSYRKLQEEIRGLEEEKTNLKKKLTEEKLKKEELEELRELSQALNFEYVETKYKLISADIITMDGSNWTNIFTINIGTENGVKTGDCVVSGLGLVGRIQDVGKNWAKVKAIIDDGSKVSFRLERDRKQLGIIKGNSKGGVDGFMMNSNSTISEGDILVTSGIGSYPKGIEIGNVKSVSYNENTLLKEITVETSVNFKELDKVAVIE